MSLSFLHFLLQLVYIHFDVYIFYVGIFISSPDSTLVDRNIIEYPILSNVTLRCRILAYDGRSDLTAISYEWNTERCFTNEDYNGGNPDCFPNGQTARDVNGYHLTAKDAGTMTCSIITSDGDTYISRTATLRITGNHMQTTSKHPLNHK